MEYLGVLKASLCINLQTVVRFIRKGESFLEQKFSRPILLLVLILWGPSVLSAEVNWTHLSSEYLDLPVPYAGAEPTASLLVDLDKDGTEDIVVGSRNSGPCVVWYQRVGQRWQRRLVDDSMQ